jgi:hypothetical protein
MLLCWTITHLRHAAGRDGLDLEALEEVRQRLPKRLLDGRHGGRAGVSHRVHLPGQSIGLGLVEIRNKTRQFT